MGDRSPARRLAALHREIEHRVGLVPAFLRATATIEMAEKLWTRTRADYLDGPLPSVFKEALFAYLSRFCPVPYCMARHAAFLLGRGGPIRDGSDSPEPEAVIELLARPPPTPDELQAHWKTLASCSEPIEVFPTHPDSTLGAAVFACAVDVYRRGRSHERSLSELRRALGDERFDALVALLGFIRSAHAWAEAHPDLAFDRDLRELLEELPPLRAWLERYRSVVAAEAEGEAELAERTSAFREEREKSEALAGAILDTVPDGVVTIDASGTIKRVNATTLLLFGYEESELLGRNVRMLMPSPWADEHDGYLARYLQTGEARIIGKGREVEARRKDGSVFPIRLGLGEARFGRDRWFTGLIHDLSEVRALQEQLLQSQKMEAIGSLASGVAHDFNNLLTSIRGSSEILIEQLEPEGRLGRSARRIQRAVYRASALTTRLLAFSRQQVTQRSTVDLGEVVGETLDLFGHTLSEDLVLSLDLCEERLYAQVDPGQIQQVLMNLLVNAVDATQAGGRLHVSTGRRANRRAIVAIQDSGLGIPQAQLSRIFDPFFTTKDVGKGTGLGLAMALRIIRDHGGEIEVESEPGVGSTFTVVLPEAAVAPEPAVVVRAEAVEPASRGGETILLCEDDAIAREVIGEVLDEAGYRIVPVASPDEALAASEREGSIDLLVTDVVLPGMSGLRLARELRARRPGLRVLFMSGYTEQVIADRSGIDIGEHLLRKPFGNDALLAKLRAMLDASEIQDPKADSSRGRAKDDPAPS